MKQSLSIISIGLLSVFSNITFAAVSSSASYGPIQIQLYDLDTTDGIAPTITFNNIHKYGDGMEISFYDPAGPLSYYELSGFGENSNTQVALNGLGYSSSITTPNANSLTGFSQSLSSYANLDGQTYNVPMMTYFNLAEFTLSANTLVRFSAIANVEATSDVGFRGDQLERSDAKVSFRADNIGNKFFSLDLFLQDHQDSLDSVSARAGYETLWTEDYMFTYLHSLGSDTKNQKNLNVGIFNFSNSTTNGYFYTKIEMNGYSLGMPVPEPETPLLMLAGLGLLVGSTRRKGTK